MTNSVDALLLRHFGLRENPFGVTPDPRFLFLTRTHGEALASLVNGIECGFGFQVLIAQPGMGKTTLLFDLLERFQSSRTAFLFQQQHDPGEFLQSLLIELKTESEETSRAKLYGQLNHFLSEAAQSHERVIVVVDEAQNLDDPLLETLRQLSNFETARAKLLQIVLAGQPQLARKLARPEQEQLKQRISTIARLSPLGLDETQTYLNHRLAIAGYRGPGVFTNAAIQMIWSSTHGIPRNMNTLCFNAMLLAYAQSAKRVDERAVREASQDLDLDYVLADIAGTHRPSIRVGNYSPISRMDPDEHRPNRNPAEVLPFSPNHGRRPAAAESSASPASADIGPHGLVPASLGPQILTSSVLLSPVLPAPVLISSVLPSPVPTLPGPTLMSPALTVPAVPAPTLPTPVASAPAAPVPTEAALKKPADPPPVVVPAAPVQNFSNQKSRPSPAAVAVSGARTGTAKKALWASLVAAALCAGVLLGHGLGTRGESSVEERPESLVTPARVQEAPPVVEVPPPPPRSERKNSFTADDGPEVIVRTFPKATPNQPDVITQQTVKVIFFDADSAALSNRYDTILQTIADILAANPESNAIIEGHTDNSGEERYNLELSTRRAAAIKQVLADNYNISAARLSTVGAGSSSPLESNSTNSGRAYNRRVEVRIRRPGA